MISWPCRLTSAVATRMTRVTDGSNRMISSTAGLRGSIPYLENWSYDGYYQSGKFEQLQTTGNGFGFTKLQQAVRALNTTNCTVTTGGCVPINLFGAAGTISQDMLNFIAIPTFRTISIEQNVTSLSANGDIGVLKTPWAKTALNLLLQNL